MQPQRKVRWTRQKMYAKHPVPPDLTKLRYVFTGC